MFSACSFGVHSKPFASGLNRRGRIFRRTALLGRLVGPEGPSYANTPMSAESFPDDFDPRFLEEAIALARQGMAANAGGPFGAVVVRGGQIIGRGWNQVTSTNDPTAHAEIVAIRDACTQLKSYRLAGCRIYASCEPCPMCLAAIYWSRIDAVYYAATAAEAAAGGFDDDFIRHELLLPEAARKLALTQHPLPGAAGLFAQWRDKSDKTPY